MPHALVVDDDSSTVLLLGTLLEQRGFSTRSAASLAEARNSLDPIPDLCMIDIRLPDGDGIELLDDIPQRTDVVVVTGHATLESSIEAMRRGARDFLPKPVTSNALDRTLSRFCKSPRGNGTERSASQLIGESPEMKRLLSTLSRIGPTDATVLVIGESGSGKELVAARLHELSRRSRGPYLALNCGAVSPNLIESELFGHEKGSFTGALRQHAGYFERAHGGTLFLDEIIEMPLELQVRLLRVLESRRVSRVGSTSTIPVDVRVIAATNRDPSEAVRQHKLREDLLYRLQVVPVDVPPLRKRVGDIRLLAQHFLSELNGQTNRPRIFAEGALNRLERYHWPGNVRELSNVVQRAAIMTDDRVITYLGALFDKVLAPRSPDTAITVCLGESLPEVERRLILHTARHCRTQDEAARMLGVSTKTLYNKLRLYESQNRSRLDDVTANPGRRHANAEYG